MDRTLEKQLLLRIFAYQCHEDRNDNLPKVCKYWQWLIVQLDDADANRRKGSEFR